jgi:hypothetical protein
MNGLTFSNVQTIVICLILLVWIEAEANAGSPVKILVSKDSYSVWTGEPATIDVQLADADNRPARSSRHWYLSLEIVAPDGTASTQSVVMAPGEQRKSITIAMNEVGVWQVVAKDNELMESAIMLNAVKKPGERGGANTGGDTNIEDLLGSYLGVKPQVELRIAPQRKLLADGKDSATVYGLLTGDNAIASKDIKLRLINSDGILQPAEVLIPKGEFSGTTQLVSDHPGEVAVEYLGAIPAVDLVGTEKLTVLFGAPITRIEIKASPPQISLLEASDLVVRFLDSSGIPLETDESRDVLLTIEQGAGQLSRNEFSIAPGNAEGRTTFRPTAVGEVWLAAASPNLVSVQVPLQVTWPIMLLIASALGGLAGGLLAFVMEKDAKWWRGAIGLITGFVLYWTVIFVGIDALAGSMAVNPLSAFVISVMGGWLGTNVFTPLLKRVGLST